VLTTEPVDNTSFGTSSRPEYPNSFAMSGSGWLMPFYFGVIEAMKARGVMNDSSIYAGTSGGSLGALIAATNFPTDEALDLIIALSKDQLLWKDVNAGLRRSLRQLMPRDALDKCQGRLHVTATRIWPAPSLNDLLTPTIISEFDTEEHLLDAVAASCFIPIYSARKLAVNIRRGARSDSESDSDSDSDRNSTNNNVTTTASSSDNELFVDGGVLAFMPPVGEVTISPFSDARFPIKPLNFRPIQIHLDPADGYSFPQLIYWGLNPPGGRKMRELYQKGRDAANRWMDRYELA